MLFYHEHRLVVVGSLVLFVGILQVTEQELRLALFLHQMALVKSLSQMKLVDFAERIAVTLDSVDPLQTELACFLGFPNRQC
jgi:hypothetical protein